MEMLILGKKGRWIFIALHGVLATLPGPPVGLGCPWYMYTLMIHKFRDSHVDFRGFSVEFESELESQNDQFRALEPPESPEFCALTLGLRKSPQGPELSHGLFSLIDIGVVH